MSIEAVVAVDQHATGSDAERLMLRVLAEWANPRGVIADIHPEDLTVPMGKNTRGVSGVKSRLKKSGQLIVLAEAHGDHGEDYVIALPGLAGQPPPEPEPVEVPDDRPDSVKAKAWRGFWEATDGLVPTSVTLSSGEIPDPDPDNAVMTDALDLLRQKRKVAEKLVTPRELALATVCIITFNHCFEWEGKKGSDYGLGANLTEIVMRVRDRPSWDAAAHKRLVESAWRIRWWEKRSGARRPSPSVIWSPKSFEQVVQDAIAEKEKGEQTSRRRYTRSAEG